MLIPVELPLSTPQPPSPFADRKQGHPCYTLIHVDDYWAFNHRPHGLLELVLGSRELSFPCVLPQMINFPVLQAFLAPLLPKGCHAFRYKCGIMGLRWTSGWSTASMAFLCRSLWVSIASFWRISCWLPL